MSEIDCESTRLITCPLCGYEDRDSWEVEFDSMEGETEVDCKSCGETFGVFREVAVTYSSHLADTPEEKAEKLRQHEKNVSDLLERNEIPMAIEVNNKEQRRKKCTHSDSM
jgi:hypothetical protein